MRLSSTNNVKINFRGRYLDPESAFLHAPKVWKLTLRSPSTPMVHLIHTGGPQQSHNQKAKDARNLALSMSIGRGRKTPE